MRKPEERELVFNLITLINKEKIVNNDSWCTNRVNLNSYCNLIRALISWSLGTGKPTSPTIFTLVNIGNYFPENEDREKVRQLILDYIKIWKAECVLTAPAIFEIISKWQTS